jgi:TolA-binding protein
LVLLLSAVQLPAQEPELERLKRPLDQMQRAFEQMQEQHRREMEALRRQLDQLQKGEAGATTPDAVRQLMQQPLTPMSPPPAAEGARLADLEKRVEDLSLATRQASQSRFNPALGLVGETVFSYRSQGSGVTGSERPGGWGASCVLQN